jgi:hypothetical protein
MNCYIFIDEYSCFSVPNVPEGLGVFVMSKNKFNFNFNL